MCAPLLMIPGTLCDKTLFEPQIAALSDLAHCQVVNHSVSDELSAVGQRILSEVEGDFAVMGLSYGGIIAFELWRQAPHRISKMILLNTNHRLPSDQTRATQQRFLGMSVLGEFRNITTDFLKDVMLHPKHAAMPYFREIVLKMAINTGTEAFFRQIKAQLNRPDSTPNLPNITCPVLVVTGREDKVCTPEIHEEMTNLMPNATLQIIEECGHLSTLEQPEVLNQLIRKWWLNQE